MSDGDEHELRRLEGGLKQLDPNTPWNLWSLPILSLGFAVFTYALLHLGGYVSLKLTLVAPLLALVGCVRLASPEARAVLGHRVRAFAALSCIALLLSVLGAFEMMRAVVP